MVKPLTIKSDLLRPLAALNRVQQGAASYYRELRRSSDPFLQVAAWCAILDGKLLGIPDWDDVVAMSRHGAVRSRAFAYFEEMLEHDLAAARGRNRRRRPAREIEQRRDARRARLRQPAKAAEAWGELYLRSGDVNHLLKASRQAEVAGGWRPSLAWAVRMVAAAPLNPAHGAAPLRRARELGPAGPARGGREYLHCRATCICTISQIFLAGAALLRGKPEVTLQKLKPLDDARVTRQPGARALSRRHPRLPRRGRGKARQLSARLRRLCRPQRRPSARQASIPAHFCAASRCGPSSTIPPLPADDIPLVVPDAGLSAVGHDAAREHPFGASAHRDVRGNSRPDRGHRPHRARGCWASCRPRRRKSPIAAARARYYEEIEAYSAQAGRRRAGRQDADPHGRHGAGQPGCFPEWRYIFSIRHPFDVVLSCFKQRFVPNPAMENFRTIERPRCGSTTSR